MRATNIKWDIPYDLENNARPLPKNVDIPEEIAKNCYAEDDLIDNIQYWLETTYNAVPNDFKLTGKPKTYTIRWKQTLVDDFEVFARNKKEAIEKLLHSGDYGDPDEICDNKFEVINIATESE